MKKELTHSQAGYLRAHLVDFNPSTELGGLIKFHCSGVQVTENGRKALKDYDAKWCIVSRETL